MKYFISRKDRIILSAIDIINELGIQGLSTKELANRQNINESALYRHFKNKDAIILGVLDFFSQYDVSIYNTVMNKNSSPKQRVMSYLSAYLEYYESYPAITAILLHYESLSHEAIAREKIADIRERRMYHLTSLIHAFNIDHKLHETFNPEELSCLINGFCDTTILKWRMAGCSYSFKNEAIETIKKLLSVNEYGERAYPDSVGEALVGAAL